MDARGCRYVGESGRTPLMFPRRAEKPAGDEFQRVKDLDCEDWSSTGR